MGSGFGFRCGCLSTAAVFAAGAAAGPRVGFADDATKYGDDGGAALFDRLKGSGAVEYRVAVYWDPANSTTIQEKGSLGPFMPVAKEKSCTSSSASTHARPPPVACRRGGTSW